MDGTIKQFILKQKEEIERLQFFESEDAEHFEEEEGDVSFESEESSSLEAHHDDSDDDDMFIEYFRNEKSGFVIYQRRKREIISSDSKTKKYYAYKEQGKFGEAFPNYPMPERFIVGKPVDDDETFVNFEDLKKVVKNILHFSYSKRKCKKMKLERDFLSFNFYRLAQKEQKEIVPRTFLKMRRPVLIDGIFIMKQKGKWLEHSCGKVYIHKMKKLLDMIKFYITSGYQTSVLFPKKLENRVDDRDTFQILKKFDLIKTLDIKNWVPYIDEYAKEKNAILIRKLVTVQTHNRSKVVKGHRTTFQWYAFLKDEHEERRFKVWTFEDAVRNNMLRYYPNESKNVAMKIENQMYFIEQVTSMCALLRCVPFKGGELTRKAFQKMFKMIRKNENEKWLLEEFRSCNKESLKSIVEIEKAIIELEIRYPSCLDAPKQRLIQKTWASEAMFLEEDDF